MGEITKKNISLYVLLMIQNADFNKNNTNLE